jgi:hypothetical protein
MSFLSSPLQLQQMASYSVDEIGHVLDIYVKNLDQGCQILDFHWAVSLYGTHTRQTSLLTASVL